MDLQFECGLKLRKEQVRRTIIGFHRDEESHWVADLDCGHAQHIRHDPPFFSRSWVMTTTGRESRMGSEWECGWCDSKTIPDGYVPYKQTPVFNTETIPSGLTQQHATKKGIWGLIHVVTGTLIYRIHHPFYSEERLDSQTPGIVLPDVQHDVHPSEDAMFYIEFWRREAG